MREEPKVPPRSRAGNHDPQAGYVLIEVIAVLAVAGLIVLLALPEISHSTSLSAVHALLSRSGATLKDARSLAISRNTNVAAIFDRYNRSLSMQGERVDYPKDLEISVTAGGSCRSEGGRVEIIFAGDGTNCGAILRIAKARQIFRLRVNWLTGYVDLLEGE